MRTRLGPSWGLVAALFAACALPPTTPPVEATRPTATPDPREANTWFAQGRAAVARVRAGTPALARARNVILFVGDGMGPSTVTAARILEGQRRGEPGEENLLAFETLPHVALSKTYNTDAQVADSASTMTAMTTGVKTRTGVLGVDGGVVRGDFRTVAAHRVATFFEEAEARGLSTGVVTTATLTHATPAGCYAHSALRNWEDDAALPEAARAAGFPDIARQLVEFPAGGGLEVALGGGRAHFLPRDASDPEVPDLRGQRLDGRDLTREWVADRPDAAYVWRRSDFKAIDPTSTAVRHLLGLFEYGHMHWEIDRAGDVAGEPSLAEMTARAIGLLGRNPQGFVLMVEAGRIDHAHHAGNAARALADTIALSDAVRSALARAGDDTLIVVTADHSHTLTFSGYPRRGNPILGKVVPTPMFARAGEDALARDALGLPYTTLGYANGPGYTGASDEQPEGPHHFPHRPCLSTPPFTCSVRGIRAGRPDLSDVDTQDPSYLQEATAPMRSETHGGEDVAIYAGGPGAALFRGVREQNYIYHAIAEALGWTQGGRPRR